MIELLGSKPIAPSRLRTSMKSASFYTSDRPANSAISITMVAAVSRCP